MKRRRFAKIGLGAVLAGTFLARIVPSAEAACEDKCRCNRRGKCCWINRARDQFGQCWTVERRCGVNNDMCDCGGCP